MSYSAAPLKDRVAIVTGGTGGIGRETSKALLENGAIVVISDINREATWFDMDWHPTLDTPEWKKAASTYLSLVQKYGPPGVTANGFNENLTLFASGKAAIWIDATVAGGILENPKQSQVVGKVGYAPSRSP